MFKDISMYIITGICLVLTFWLAGIAGSRLKGTTLATAATWCRGGLAVAVIAVSLHLSPNETPAGQIDLAWYLASVLMLCPGIAVLGARRPNARVWGLFVLLPLVLVLMWPAVASTRVLKAGVPLELEEPALIGFGLVLIMASGNYLGTRYTLSTMLYAVAMVLLVAPMSATVPDIFPDRELSRMLASLALLSAASIAMLRSCAKPPPDVGRFDRLWIDFVDTFGMVWAKRVMDRMNQSAEHEKWTKRLEMHAFVSMNLHATAEETSRTEERIEHTFRWLMKRFTDNYWVDSRLGKPVGETEEDAAGS